MQKFLIDPFTMMLQLITSFQLSPKTGMRQLIVALSSAFFLKNSFSQNHCINCKLRAVCRGDMKQALPEKNIRGYNNILKS